MHEREGDTDDDELEKRQLDARQRIKRGGNQIEGEAVDLGAEDALVYARDDGGAADRGDHGGQMMVLLLPKRADGKEVDGKSKGAGNDHARGHGRKDADPEARGCRQSGEGACHEHRSVGQGDDLQHAEDQRETQGEEGVDGTKGDAVGELL